MDDLPQESEDVIRDHFRRFGGPDLLERNPIDDPRIREHIDSLCEEAMKIIQEEEKNR